MYCSSCGQKNPELARFCMYCGKITAAGSHAGLQQNAPHASHWANLFILSVLFVIGLIGIYVHPLLEVGMVTYVVIGASTAWVFADSPGFGLKRWPWALGTLALWFLVFPVYLMKTRGIRALVPAVIIVAVVLGMLALPEVYSANKHFHRGLIYAGQQKLTKAEGEFSAAIKRDPTLGEARLNLGILYMSEGLLDAAEKELLQAKELLERHGVHLIPGTKNQALSLCLAHLSAVYAMRASEAIQMVDRKDAKKYFTDAQKYANEAIQLDKDNVRSNELVRRLQQLAALLE